MSPNSHSICIHSRRTKRARYQTILSSQVFLIPMDPHNKSDTLFDSSDMRKHTPHISASYTLHTSMEPREGEDISNKCVALHYSRPTSLPSLCTRFLSASIWRRSPRSYHSQCRTLVITLNLILWSLLAIISYISPFMQDHSCHAI